MVHYSQSPRSAAQGIPPLCPKCGSHRTEVVGRSSDLKTVTVRCNACGERSEMPVDKENAAERAAVA